MRTASRLSVGALGSLMLTACASAPPPPKPPLTQQRPLGALLEAAAYPNSDTLLVLVTMQQLIATHREWEGYAYFGRLAEEQPNRRALFASLQATMQARVAREVPLLRRVAWVDDAIRKLDEGAAADPQLGRLARGLVFAELPPRFGKARQAVEDLEACLGHGLALPLGLDRGIYRGLAAAYWTLGDEPRAQEMLARAGLPSLDDPDVPRVLGDLSVDGRQGFRFGTKRLAREAEGVYVAEGYDFANIAFLVTPAFVVAIDAGTTEETAREAVSALRQVTRAPIKYVILTHGHWDHVGGLGAVREPGSTVIASAGFPAELARSRDYPPPFHYFFGTGTMKLDAKPDRLVAAPERLTDGGLDLVLLPAPSGETSDALFVQDKKHDLPVRGRRLHAVRRRALRGRGLGGGISGRDLDGARAAPAPSHPRPHAAHRAFTIEAMPGLKEAMGALYQRGLGAARAARPLADLLHDDFLPASLRTAPAVVQPYLLARDTFLQRLYTEHGGYWQSNGDGIDVFSRGEWAAARTSWAVAATLRSSGPQARSRGAATRRSRCRSRSSASGATQRARRCRRAARAR